MSDSTMFENPFRAGGEISKDADDIVDAFKNGKLSLISNSDIEDRIDDKDDETREYLVQPLERKNGVIAVNTKRDKFGQEVFNDGKEKKPYCQPQAKAKAKAMPGRLYIHTINK